MGIQQMLNGCRFFVRKDGAVVATGGTAASKVTGAYLGFKCGVIETGFAELGAEGVCAHANSRQGIGHEVE